jgi:hypothetical protein
MKNLTIVDIKNPLTKDDGYDYTENFDGKIKINDNVIYFNLKFICDNGGAQTRSLREVYHFIQYQILYIKKHNLHNIYFVNILDGDTSYKNITKFNYLLNQYEDIKKYVFVSDLYNFKIYWDHTIN